MRAFKIVSLLFVVALPLSALSASGADSLSEDLIAQSKLSICRQFKSNKAFVRFSLPLPSFCKTVTSPPPPPPPPLPLPTVDLSALPLTIELGGTSTLSWLTTDADLCDASLGWSGIKPAVGSTVLSPTATTTYSLACGNATGTTTDSVTVNVILPPEPEPEPTLDHLVISEVYYRGSSANEWIEIHNNTGGLVIMDGWTISDAASSDALSTTTIPNGGFAIITGSTTLASSLSIPSGTQIILLGNTSIGSGLNDTGDAVYLKNGAVVVDSISYGTNIDVFNPGIGVVAEGHSIRRASLDADTDTAGDWVDTSPPTPGSF
jgi:hypothetical protein